MDDTQSKDVEGAGTDPATQDKVYWHEAFYEALQLELHKYKDFLKFENERLLSKEALKMDVLIVKKEKDIEIDKNIGKIFKGHNIFEYKSETDYLSIYDYYKVLGYALLYASFEKINKNDISVSFAVSRHPRGLFKYLEDELKLKVEEVENGIHYVVDDIVSIQILEQKKLSSVDNLFIRGLNSKVSIEDLENILNAYKSYSDNDWKNVYLDRLLQANKEIFLEVENMTGTAKEVFLEVADKHGWYRERVENEKLEIARKLLKLNRPIGEVIEVTGLTYEQIERLQV